jgi:hypothetical protein
MPPVPPISPPVPTRLTLPLALISAFSVTESTSNPPSAAGIRPTTACIESRNDPSRSRSRSAERLLRSYRASARLKKRPRTRAASPSSAGRARARLRREHGSPSGASELDLARSASSDDALPSEVERWEPEARAAIGERSPRSRDESRRSDIGLTWVRDACIHRGLGATSDSACRSSASPQTTRRCRGLLPGVTRSDRRLPSPAHARACEATHPLGREGRSRPGRETCALAKLHETEGRSPEPRPTCNEPCVLNSGCTRCVEDGKRARLDR